MLGQDWVLCSCENVEIMESILCEGPWFIKGHIMGIEKWSPSFSTNSLKGLSAPVWVRLPNLPLYCWDNLNICRIASLVGKPFLLDGNMFKWNRREFARICVCINLYEQLPLGVWVEDFKNNSNVISSRVDYVLKANAVHEVDVANVDPEEQGYGPWMQVRYGRKKKFQNNAVKVNQKPTARPIILKEVWKPVTGSVPAVVLSQIPIPGVPVLAAEDLLLVKNLKNDDRDKDLVNDDLAIDRNLEEREIIEDMPINKLDLSQVDNGIPTSKNLKTSQHIILNNNMFDILNTVNEDANNVAFTMKNNIDGNVIMSSLKPKDMALTVKKIKVVNSSVKRKLGKEIKTLGPIKLLTRNRRMEMENKDKKNGASPPSNQ
ncbi:uncharacterized protein LOC110113480 [Dendrobium catenatum]|uniref:uncharacterized protein LOC110113480 n=1 Tax=Dendrobium catenatum TaxID=906689 RepID=UPI0009F73500|nr:uncharacterized protein LOC110113480 [Dendrobium catenatum]